MNFANSTTKAVKSSTSTNNTIKRDGYWLNLRMKTFTDKWVSIKGYRIDLTEKERDTFDYDYLAMSDFGAALLKAYQTKHGDLEPGQRFICKTTAKYGEGMQLELYHHVVGTSTTNPAAEEEALELV